MPPEENKTKDAPQQDSVPVEPEVVAENAVPEHASVERPAEEAVTEASPVAPAKKPESKSEPEVVQAPGEVIEPEPELAPAEQAQEEAPVVESPDEQISPEPESAPVTEASALTQAKPATEPQNAPVTPTLTPAQPEIKVVEKIVYKTDPNIIQKLLVKTRVKIQERKQKKLDKIMTLFEANDSNLPAGTGRSQTKTFKNYLRHQEFPLFAILKSWKGKTA